ncbi:MAG: hypothetical protein M3362_01505 [Acidobacteriota bacterium]|nr:hypothetical protein [Acidobacteriota bacterium]
MLLPMMVFPFALAGFGCLMLLIAAVNRRFPPLSPKPFVPYLGFICLFAGSGAFFLSIGLAVIGDTVLRSDGWAALGLLMGYVVGGCGGAAFGFKAASSFNRPG